MVVQFQPQAREKAAGEGFEIKIVKTSFKANTKALAENEGDGLAKVYSGSCAEAEHRGLATCGIPEKSLGADYAALAPVF